ncbi:hypothetical protein OIU85_006155 [Salix viminalis]|uniref:Uncharacterized protein n=1 Tax=Salix viminalis TaxID=40686 RepID=A0A9Q0PL34_SALVM|nr:hypothetical protein OIU85_006155 [Salix viminalis]
MATLNAAMKCLTNMPTDQTDSILRSKSTPCSIHRNHNHPRTTNKEDRIPRATPKALAHVRSAFASAAYFASQIATKQAPLPRVTISRCSGSAEAAGLATESLLAFVHTY